MKKISRFFATLLIVCFVVNTSVYASEGYDYKEDTSIPVNSYSSAFSSYDDPILYEMIKKYNFTPEQVARMDAAITEVLSQPQTRSISVGAVIGIVSGIVALEGASYAVGQYAARQCEVRLGLTPAAYRANRWAIRAGLLGLTVSSGGSMALLCLGFDDYFMGG